MSRAASRHFHRFGGQRNVQVNLTRYWAGLGLRTWPPAYTGRQKRAVHFGLGYLSWELGKVYDRKPISEAEAVAKLWRYERG